MTKLTAQIPSLGIMQTADYKSAKSYRIACDCHSSDHDVNCWIEIEGDTECQEVEVGFYVDMWTPWWATGFNRFKAIWQLLTTGIVRQEHHIILKKQVALNLAGTIEQSIKDLEKNV
jgi:hypothetical protein